MSIDFESLPNAKHGLAHETIHQGDCVELMQNIETGSIDLVFADPPFNIGFEYDQYHDRHDKKDYIDWCVQWMTEIQRVLKPNGTFWLAIGDEYAAELKVAAQDDVGFRTRSWVVWYYTFGVNCTKKFSRSHVHLFHFVKDENNFTFNAEDPQVRVPSARALVYADKRANPAGRLPDDTWIVRPAADDGWVLRPQDLPEGFQPSDDTWYYARVAGTFKERQGFHGCQMPEQLLGRIVRVSSNEGDVVLDPFAGTGTTLAVAKKLARQWIGCEISEKYVQEATDRLNATQVGDDLDGPPDPIASAPSTTNGKKLENISTKAAVIPLAINGSARGGDSTIAEHTTANGNSNRNDLRDAIREAIIKAFHATHEGFSTDWLLASPALQTAFHEACHDTGLIGTPADWNRMLLRLRKSGCFPKNSEVKAIHFSVCDMEDYGFASEIAWRLTSERFRGASLDEIFCDPEKSVFFDRTAKRFALKYDAAGCRWAALRLRKASKDLVQDMKQFHFVVSTRDFPRRAMKLDSCDIESLSGKVGVYLLQNSEKERLYLDHTFDLGRRLAHHANKLNATKNVGYVTVIPPNELPGPLYENALKVDLVRRYDPLLNVNLARLFETVAV